MPEESGLLNVPRLWTITPAKQMSFNQITCIPIVIDWTESRPDA